MGAVLGGSGPGNQERLYAFGKNLGIAFQIQDDYLDAFGDPSKFGKQVGGDILANKKTFLLIHALESGSANQVQELTDLINTNPPDKVERVLSIFRNCGVDKWAFDLKEKYISTACQYLDDAAIVSVRKQPLQSLAQFLVQRQY
jgi:geranylgeranyl diphosphate synthase type II